MIFLQCLRYQARGTGEVELFRAGDCLLLQLLDLLGARKRKTAVIRLEPVS
jgi:hypothetical protein